MTRVVPAALALACVCSPAMAAAPADLHHAFTVSLFVLSLGGMALAALFCLVRRVPALAILGALTLAIVLIRFGAHPALAQEAVAQPGVTLPYGSWIAAYGPELFMLLATWLAGLASWAVTKFAPWAASMLTQKRIEMATQALAQYGTKAVIDATKDGKGTVNAGPAVIQAAVQRGVNVLPARLIKAIEKGGGMPSIIFRVLDLEDAANEHNVLQPAIASLKSSTDPKLAKAA